MEDGKDGYWVSSWQYLPCRFSARCTDNKDAQHMVFSLHGVYRLVEEPDMKTTFGSMTYVLLED